MCALIFASKGFITSRVIVVHYSFWIAIFFHYINSLEIHRALPLGMLTQDLHFPKLMSRKENKIDTAVETGGDIQPSETRL